MSSQWERVPEAWAIGQPIAECHDDGAVEVSKLAGSGGIVDEWTVKEHLRYEVHDPRRYVMPDGGGTSRASRSRTWVPTVSGAAVPEESPGPAPSPGQSPYSSASASASISPPAAASAPAVATARS